MIDQGELFSIPNPCRGICQVNNKGYCKGCLRSRDERFYWQEFTPFQRQLIINACDKRRKRILQAKQDKESLLDHDLADIADEQLQLSLLPLEPEQSPSLPAEDDYDKASDKPRQNSKSTSRVKPQHGQTEPLEQPDLFSDSH